MICLRVKRGGKKSSVQHSATDLSELKDGRRRKDKKDEKYNDDKTKFCKSGLYNCTISPAKPSKSLVTTIQSVGRLLNCHLAN